MKKENKNRKEVESEDQGTEGITEYGIGQGDKRKRKWKWMSGVWQTGETRKRGNEERGIGDVQRSNR